MNQDCENKASTVQWREQTVNMACLPACIAMLLSTRQINCESWHIIENTLMPYRISYDVTEDCFIAGLMFEADRITQSQLASHYGVQLRTDQFPDFDTFLTGNYSLMGSKTPFITSVNPCYLPLPLYDSIRESSDNHGGHAVVVTGMASDQIRILDPETGFRATPQKPYSTSKNPTICNVSIDEYRKAVASSGSGRLIIGTLMSCSKRIALSTLDLLKGINLPGGEHGQEIQHGIHALRLLPDLITRWRQRVIDFEVSDGSSEQNYRSGGLKYIRPLAQCYSGALMASWLFHSTDDSRRAIYQSMLIEIEIMKKTFFQGLGLFPRSGKFPSDFFEPFMDAAQRLITCWERLMIQ